MPATRYFFDTEFIEFPGHLDLISIGMVCEDGRQYYAESAEVDWSRASQWVLNNVKPHLKGGEYLKSREEIKQDILLFTGGGKDLLGGEEVEWPEFWAYYADYDWVAFCWLFGSMIDLPKSYPMFCRDIKQWAMDLGNPALPSLPGMQEHFALDDARWTINAWNYLNAHSRKQKA